MRSNLIRLALALSAACALAATFDAQAPQAPAAGGVRMYNTVKQKLKDGKQVVGATMIIPDPDVYCAVANAGFDFTWIEMQHSPLTYQEVAHLLFACKGASAIPFIRVPDAVEGDIQKATDIGALGIIIPMVDTVEKAENAVKFAKYPPVGRRSQGNGQYGALWGNDYRRTANDNVMIVAMIENPAGVAIVDKIAAVPGVDAIFVASTDLGSFSGFRQGEANYEALVDRIFAVTKKAGLALGGPLAWKDTRKGYNFFQGPGETQLLRSGSQVTLGGQPAEAGQQRGVAPVEGAGR